MGRRAPPPACISSATSSSLRPGRRRRICQRLVLRELIYRTKHAWIKILADENDTTARFSITVTDPRFRFPVRDLTFYQRPSAW